MFFGAHCSGGVKKAIDHATEIGANALQLFVQSPRAWRFPDHDPADLAAFRERRKEAGLGGVLVHSLYLVNLASPNDDFYEKSVYTMRRTVETSCAIEAEGVVLHVGSFQGTGVEAGMDRVVPALESILELCSEPTHSIPVVSSSTAERSIFAHLRMRSVTESDLCRKIANNRRCF